MQIPQLKTQRSTIHGVPKARRFVTIKALLCHVVSSAFDLEDANAHSVGGSGLDECLRLLTKGSNDASQKKGQPGLVQQRPHHCGKTQHFSVIFTHNSPAQSAL